MRPGRASRTPDGARVQRSALRVGLWVGIASAAIVGTIALITVTALLRIARPERGRPPGRGRGRWEDRVVEVGDVVPLVAVLAAVGVVLLALIAWYVARRATRPLAEALEVQRAFVADASHELRTPLTTLSTRIQLAQHRSERGAEVGPVLAELRNDAQVMDGVLTDLLLAAESAAGPPRTLPTCSLQDAVTDAVAVLAPRAEAAQISLELDVSPALWALADRTALARAVVALMDNAIRHAPAGSAVTVATSAARDGVALRVTDRGSGIAGDPERLFERFARSEATDGARRGFGLGLALVRDVVSRYGGSVHVSETSPAGTTFLIRLRQAP